MAKGSGGSVGLGRSKGRSRGQYEYVGFDRPIVKQAIKNVFGKNKVTAQDIAKLAGAFKGSTVEFSIFDGDLAINVKNSLVSEQFRRISKDKDGIYIYNELFEKKSGAKSGVGARMLAVQAKAAGRLGIGRIKTNAAGSFNSEYGFNGYYTWARLGYNAPLNSSTRSKLPSSLSSATTIHGLFRLKGGAQWWKENGTSTNMEFDARPNSTSRKILAAYLKSKRKN